MLYLVFICQMRKTVQRDIDIILAQIISIFYIAFACLEQSSLMWHFQ